MQALFIELEHWYIIYTMSWYPLFQGELGRNREGEDAIWLLNLLVN